MKKSITLIVLAVLAVCMRSHTVHAQQSTVRALFIDSLTMEGEPYATIRIIQNKNIDKPVLVAVTDLDGLFEQQLSGRGEYEMLFSSVGRTTVIIPFTLTGQPVCDLGTINVTDDVLQLKSIEVVAHRPLVRMEVDKMSYNIEEDVDAKSNSVLDMLRKVPMVTVDGNDNITVNGSSSFKVFVDGKPNMMISSNPSTILKNMPATSIKNIEVITNPGARYDAEGVGGVLNLVTNKLSDAANPVNAYNGTLRGMYNTKGGAGGVYFSLQQGKLTMTLNGNLVSSKVKDMETSFSREQISNSGNSFIDNYQGGDSKFKIRMGNLNMGYEFDSLRLLTASFGLMSLGHDMDYDTRTALYGGIYGTGFDYTGSSLTKGNNTSFNGSIDYQRLFAGNKDRVLTLSYLISTSPNNSDTYSLFDDVDGLNQFLNLTDRYTDSQKNTIENTFQVDYSTPIGTGQNLDMGVKYIMRNNSSDSKYYLMDNGIYDFNINSSLNYKHNNDILAGYAEYGGKWNRWGLKAGLRYEYTWQDVKYKSGQGTDFKMDYGNLVPSGSLSYKITEFQNIGLTYNMRISRPGINYLNPYVDRSDPTSISYGNTKLESEKAHNISMVYNLYSPKWILSLTLRQSLCNNAIEGYSFYENNILNSTYGNILKNSQTGLNAYVNWNAARNTRINLNGSISYVDLRSSEIDWSNNGWQGSIMAGVQQTLPWKLRLSLNVMATTKQYNLQGWNSGFNGIMASLSRSFVNDKLNVSVSGMTNMSGNGLEMRSYSKGHDYINNSVTSLPIRNLGISVSYTFRKQQAATKRTKRTIQNTDVKDAKSQTEAVGTMIVQ